MKKVTYTEISEFNLITENKKYICGIKLGYIESFLQNINISKFESEQKLIVGMINYNEKVVPIIDLHKFLELENSKKFNDYIIVNINDNIFGFGVNELKKVRKINNVDILQPFKALKKKQKIFLDGIYLLENEQMLQIYDFEKINQEIFKKNIIENQQGEKDGNYK
jgi:two-component system chemotaxis response regulator CheV